MNIKYETLREHFDKMYGSYFELEITDEYHAV